METLKNNSNSIRENKESYISPSCNIYDLEMEGIICSSDQTTGNMEEITSGGEFPGTSFWNNNN